MAKQPRSPHAAARVSAPKAVAAKPATVAKQTAAPASMTICKGEVVLTMTGAVKIPPGIYAIVFDGQALAQVSVGAATDRVVFSLPPHILPYTVDVVDHATGRSILPYPLPLDEALGLRIERASIGDAALTVEATMGGEPVVALAVAVVDEAGTVFAAGLAPCARTDREGRGWYVCTLPLMTLLPVNVPFSLTLHASGRRLEPALTGSAQTVGIAGYVDHASPEGITGWAADLRDPARRLKIDVKNGDRLLGSRHCR